MKESLVDAMGETATLFLCEWNSYRNERDRSGVYGTMIETNEIVPVWMELL